MLLVKIPASELELLTARLRALGAVAAEETGTEELQAAVKAEEPEALVEEAPLPETEQPVFILKIEVIAE
jgi:hypothetical protein